MADFGAEIPAAIPAVAGRGRPVRKAPINVKSMPGTITFVKTVTDEAPKLRATVTRWAFTWRMPASTASVTGKKPSRKPKAILDAASRPKKSMSDGYQTTDGTA